MAPLFLPTPRQMSSAEPTRAALPRAAISYIAPLPAFQSPAIVHEQPLYWARVPRMRGVFNVRASSLIEAKLRASKQLGVHVQSVVVQEAHDPKRVRLNWRA